MQRCSNKDTHKYKDSFDRNKYFIVFIQLNAALE